MAALVKKQGGILLGTWLAAERRSQDWLAEQIGAHQTTVSRWMRGDPIPLAVAIEIRRVTGIPIEEWVQPATDSSRDLTADETGPHKLTKTESGDDFPAVTSGAIKRSSG